MALQLFVQSFGLLNQFLPFLLSWTSVFQFGTFDFRISFLKSSSQRIFGLPISLLQMGFQEYIALNILVFLHPFNVTKPSQSLCPNEVYYVLVFYYFIQFLVGTIFVG